MKKKKKTNESSRGEKDGESRRGCVCFRGTCALAQVRLRTPLRRRAFALFYLLVDGGARVTWRSFEGGGWRHWSIAFAIPPRVTSTALLPRPLLRVPDPLPSPSSDVGGAGVAGPSKVCPALSLSLSVSLSAVIANSVTLLLSRVYLRLYLPPLCAFLSAYLSRFSLLFSRPPFFATAIRVAFYFTSPTFSNPFRLSLPRSVSVPARLASPLNYYGREVHIAILRLKLTNDELYKTRPRSE